MLGEKGLYKHQCAELADNVIILLISCLIKATVQDPTVTCPLSWWRTISATSVEFVQLCLQRLEVADSLLKGGVGAQRLQLHKVSTNVIKAHVSESAPKTEGKQSALVQAYSKFWNFQSQTRQSALGSLVSVYQQDDHSSLCKTTTSADPKLSDRTEINYDIKTTKFGPN